MDARGLLAARQRSHRLTAPAATIADAARHMLAVQSQDLLAGRWALGVRTAGSPTLRDVDAAFAEGILVRTWTMRGTLHIIPARDVMWVLAVTAPRQRQQAASRRRDLGIDDAMLDVAWRALEPAVRDGGCTRAEAFAVLEAAGIAPGGQRGVHLLFALSIDGRLCQAAVSGDGPIPREQRFVAMDEWVPESARRDDPLAELLVRYIDGHGPAGVRDFAWWSGLTLTAARDAVERAAHRVREIDDGLYVAGRLSRGPVVAGGAEGSAFALPAFDEYYISYADRTLVCDDDRLAAVGPGSNGMVRPTVIEGGRVTGTWSHARAAHGAPPQLFGDRAVTPAVSAAMTRFAEFIAD